MTSQRQCTGLSFVTAWLACIIAQRTNYEDRCRITLCLMDTIGHVALAVITGTITLVTYNSVKSLLFISRSDTRRFYAYSILKWVVRLKISNIRIVVSATVTKATNLIGNQLLIEENVDNRVIRKSTHVLPNALFLLLHPCIYFDVTLYRNLLLL